VSPPTRWRFAALVSTLLLGAAAVAGCNSDSGHAGQAVGGAGGGAGGAGGGAAGGAADSDGATTDGDLADAGTDAAPAVSYDIADLGALPNDMYAEARALSENGKVAVLSKPLGAVTDSLGALWADGTLTDIGTVPSRPIIAPNGINNAGIIVGTSSLTSMTMPLQINRAFITMNGMAAELLPGTPGDNSTAIAINDANQVLGTHLAGSFLWDDGTLTELFPASMGKAAALGNNAVVAGNGADSKAFLWKGGTVTACGTLGTGTSSVAMGINDAGDIVGNALVAPIAVGQTGVSHAFECSAGVMTDLGTLYGAGSSGATDINNKGDVVGQNTDTTNMVHGAASHAFLYRNGQMTNLSDRIPAGSDFTVLDYAFAINDAGQIVGRGFKADPTRAYAFLLTPKP
jgi:probable HAF family extracellular repeat protein